MSNVLNQVISELNKEEEKRWNHNQNIDPSDENYKNHPMYDEDFQLNILTRLVDEINHVETQMKTIEKEEPSILNQFYEYKLPPIAEKYQSLERLLFHLKVQVIALYPNTKWVE